MAPIEQLPLELREQICDLVGHVPHSSHDHLMNCFDPLEIMPPNMSKTRKVRHSPPIYPHLYSSAYSDLRALSVTSRALTGPAQRVLFRTIVVQGSAAIMLLLRSLLLYPKNRKLVRSLAVFRKDFLSDYFGEGGETLDEFMEILGSAVCTPAFNEIDFQDGTSGFFRRLVTDLQEWLGDKAFSYNFRYNWPSVMEKLPHLSFDALGDHTLWAIGTLCPLIQEVQASYNGCDVSGLTPLRRYSRPALTLPDAFASVKSLTLDITAFMNKKALVVHRDEYNELLHHNIESLTLVGSQWWTCHHELDLGQLHRFLLGHQKLRELRVLRGCDDSVWSDELQAGLYLNWNTVLLAVKDTLEVFVLEGTEHMHDANNTADDDDVLMRFGETKMLECLPEMKSLKYLKTSLHTLRDDSPQVHIPKTLDKEGVLQLIKTGLPPNLERMDLVVVESTIEEGEEWSLFYRIERKRTVRVYF